MLSLSSSEFCKNNTMSRLYFLGLVILFYFAWGFLGLFPLPSFPMFFKQLISEHLSAEMKTHFKWEKHLHSFQLTTPKFCNTFTPYVFTCTQNWPSVQLNWYHPWPSVFSIFFRNCWCQTMESGTLCNSGHMLCTENITLLHFLSPHSSKSQLVFQDSKNVYFSKLKL